MPEPWTGEIIGKLHNFSITRADVAEELGVTKAYVTMLLNGSRKTLDAQEKITSAVDAIIARRGM